MQKRLLLFKELVRFSGYLTAISITVKGIFAGAEEVNNSLVRSLTVL